MVLLASTPKWLGYARAADAQEVTVVILTRTFNACTHIFTPHQEKLWSQLGEQIPKDWILYGDTALGLRMGHRASPDFELKSAKDFEPEAFRASVPFLRDAKVLEGARNHLKVAVGGPTPVEMTFSGGQTIAQIHPPDRASNGLPVASLADLAAEKMHKISGRPREEDYRDIGALLHEGTSMDEMVGCATAAYGARFDYKEAQKNLTSVDRSDARLGPEMESTLIREGAGGRHPVHTRIHSERITTETREAAQRPRREHSYERAVDPYDLRDPFDRQPFERE